MDFDDDAGRIRLTVEAKQIDVTLDAIDAHDQLVDLSLKHKEDPDAYAPALRAWFGSQGVAGVSSLTLIRMRNAIYERVAALLGKGQPAAGSAGPDSPASTGSTAAPSPAPGSPS